MSLFQAHSLPLPTARELALGWSHQKILLRESLRLQQLLGSKIGYPINGGVCGMSVGSGLGRGKVRIVG